MTWDDIGGLEGPKRIVKEMVSLPLKKPELLAKHQLTIPSGVLIWGPLGVGITMLAEAADTSGSDETFDVSKELASDRDPITKNIFTMTITHVTEILFPNPDLLWWSITYLRR